MEEREIIEQTGGQIEGRPIETITAEIRILKARAGEDIIGIGQRLIEAKEQLPHGEWLPWLENEVQFSERSAQQFMRIAKEWSNPQTLADLGVSKALNLLALPPSEREDFLAEKHVVNGKEKSVEDMTARELQKAIREKKDVEDELTALRRAAKLDEDRMREEIEVLQAKIEALESQPKEVSAVEVVKDEAEEARLKAEISELKKKMADQKQKSKDLIQMEASKISRLQKEKDEAIKAEQATSDALRQQIDYLKKQLQTASSGELAAFKVHFEQAKDSVDAMWEIILRTRSSDPQQAEKLRNAAEGLVKYAQEVMDAKK